jgi:hypothetical protein
MQQDPPSCDAVQDLVASARTNRAFEGWSRTKPDTILLLELAADPRTRVHALEGLAARVAFAKGPTSATRIAEAVSRCMPLGGSAPAATGATTIDGADPRFHDWKQRLAAIKKRKPFKYDPVSTTAISPHRMPYEGIPTRLSVGELEGGVGCFMASAIAVGMQGVWMGESNTSSLALAQRNCPSVPHTFGATHEVDPAHLPWCQVLLSRSHGQPFTKQGLQQGFADERAYATLRLLHNIGAVRPWFAVSENVSHIEHTHQGGVWSLVKGSLENLGYHVNPIRVCASR